MIDVVASNTASRAGRFTVFLVLAFALQACGSQSTDERADDPYYAKVTASGSEPTLGPNVFTWSCGRNLEGHRNTANYVVAPGVPGPPHHVHDYVGNLSTGLDSTDATLAAADTTCTNGDKSTYYWPVLRKGVRADTGHGEIEVPLSVTLTAYPDPNSEVVAMPRLMRATTGDARAATHDTGLARPTWTCAGGGSLGTRYPLCPRGARVLRVFDFPSCWDGRRVDSPDHRAHLVFPGQQGCPSGTFAVPRLRLVVAYSRPDGDRFAIDGFPDQRGNPVTDHAFLVNLMSEKLMTRIVKCLNTGEDC
ncbi:hypothetical protein Pa4123_66930 [Phytohabitans aurantiacus]|uniref:DUF1996 domain-containing protein n=1 Tax=Phytohabitans aurantiacus TaxID=3016789 RepID=A0ABQ5R5F0_9ACTN|nr:hypothetical protein Pa4123_66930 [Phytohabitans aurantiacus]